MGAIGTIEVRSGRDETELVPLWTMAEGLAVAEPQEGRFTVTHVRSGFAIWPSFPSERPRTFEAALRAWAVALDSGVEFGIDWTQDAETIKAQHAGRWPAIRNRMRLAVCPPRRSRWHGTHRRRRVKPWQAAAKARALRDAAKVDLRSCWRNFFYPCRWREEFYGTALIRPRRQGCTRFVARKAAQMGVLRRMARRASFSIGHNARHLGQAEDRVQGYGVIVWGADGRVAELRPWPSVEAPQ
jgi:hypothetical protein